jgi:hypothetical protein
MTKLQEAMAKLSTLPEATQDNIAEELLLHVRKVESLRRELQKGIDSFDRGEFDQLDIEETIKRARAAYQGS